ncbi:hypothetical protein BH23GEM3_BH23GEM3_12970 [soil metagenome]|jgi:hypothetical protein|nr:hypothetical protein [Gemmatimonadota bacterium]
MTHSSLHDVEAIRAEAAADERAAILNIIERAMRQLAHGHGSTGAQVLQHLSDEIHRRGENPA